MTSVWYNLFTSASVISPEERVSDNLCQRLTMFSSRSFWFYVLYLILSSILSLILYVMKKVVPFHFLYVAVQFSDTLYWRDCLFIIVYSCLICHRLICHINVDIIPGSLFCSIDLPVSFVQLLSCWGGERPALPTELLQQLWPSFLPAVQGASPSHQCICSNSAPTEQEGTCSHIWTKPLECLVLVMGVLSFGALSDTFYIRSLLQICSHAWYI